MKLGKRTTRLLLRIGIVLVLAGAAWAGWSTWSARTDKPLEARYQFEEVGVGDITQTVTANGTVNPVGLVNVGTQVSGTVRRLYADFNDEVKAGQILLELDPTTTQAAVEQSSGEVASAEASLRLARAEEARMRELFGQEYVSRQDLERAIQAREAAQAQLRVARGKLQRDRANLGYTVIRSPVSGVVVSREVDLGQTVAASFQTPTLFKIARDLSRMQIDSNVAEADIGKVRVGQNTRFTVDAYPERRFEGKVQQIRLAPITEQNVVTYNVVVEVANPDQALLPGMTAYLSIVTDRRENVLLVPNAALRFRPSDAHDIVQAQRNADAHGGTPGRPEVYVARGQLLQPVEVAVGISDGRFSAVTGGELSRGDRVAVEQLQGEGKPAGGATPQPFRFRTF
ncbi:MAG: efflux RND transporter periplasmic adaptor subunit [Burkholderiales bacterium]|nr:efflux RND transporter periplasmic adaptor subunit [Burkholderiales bacterium]